LTVSTFEFEHIIPRSADGETVLENLCLSCPSCNRYKAQRQQASDPDTNELVALFHPHWQKWIEHFAWSEGGISAMGI
jgi:5-methylcytosine-specific restriction endonuclease McrA